jgi:NADPH:quinone reductase-like Zn-dependent oxidoreductase
MRTNFRACVVNQIDEVFQMGTQRLRRQDLPPGEVLIQVANAAMNYKDALVCTAQGKVAQTSPLVPGLEFAGRVVESRDKRFTSGDEVMAYDFGSTQGISRHGGFCEYARVPAEMFFPWVLPPRSTSSRRSSMWNPLCRDCSDVQPKEARNCIGTGGSHA